jgi:hypothetical protein
VAFGGFLLDIKDFTGDVGPHKTDNKVKRYILYSYQRSSTDNCFDRLFDYGVRWTIGFEVYEWFF